MQVNMFEKETYSRKKCDKERKDTLLYEQPISRPNGKPRI